MQQQAVINKVISGDVLTSAVRVMTWGRCAMTFDSIEFALDHEAMGQSHVQFCPTLFLEYIFTPYHEFVYPSRAYIV
jgi:hypothetical protein